jgi:hypothetical protein
MALEVHSSKFFSGSGKMRISHKTACCCLIFLAIPFLLGGRQAKTGQQTSTSPREFAEGFYKWYVPRAFRAANENLGRAWTVALKYKASAFDPKLVQLLREDSTAQDKCEDLVGLDFDPFLNTQDPAGHYEVGSITRVDQHYRASIYSVESGKRSEKPNVIAEFSEDSGRWVFTNFFYPDVKTDLVAALKLPKLPCSRPRPSTEKQSSTLESGITRSLLHLGTSVGKEIGRVAQPLLGVALDKNEGAVKRHLCAAMLFCTALTSELVENRSSGHLAVNHFSVKSFHQPSIRPFTSAMILLSESRFASGRERPINPWT